MEGVIPSYLSKKLQVSKHTTVPSWIDSAVEPTTWRPSEDTFLPPSVNIELEWVHGYRSYDTRSNLRYCSNGDFVYFVSTIGVVYNKKRHEQRYYQVQILY